MALLATRASGARVACTRQQARPALGLSLNKRVAFVRQPTVAVRLFGGGGSGNNGARARYAAGARIAID